MKKSTVLRWSLLATLGFLPLACNGDDDDRGSQNVGGSGGTTSEGGSAGSADEGGSAGSAGEGGSAGSATDAGGAAGGGFVIGMPPSCTSPRLDEYGITTCQEGYHYRETPFACAFRADEGPGAGGGGGGEGGGGGNSAADPVASPNGCFPACEGEHAYCHRISATPIIDVCTRGCLTDDECADSELCQCDGERGGVCVAANCRGDADCGDGYHCAQAEICTGNNTGNFACQTTDDECFTRQDCDQSSCGMDFEEGNHRICYDERSCG